MKASFAVLITLLFSACEVDRATGENSPNTELPTGAEVTQYEDDSQLSIVTTRNARGGITAQGTYMDGEKQGNWTEYYPNGMVKSIANYQNGRREGLSLVLSNTGQLEESITYHNDLKHGENKSFVRNRVKSESTYVNGKLEGLTSLYYDNGTIMEEGMYKDGIRHGISKWYDQQGNLKFEYEYNEGALVK